MTSPWRRVEANEIIAATDFSAEVQRKEIEKGAVRSRVTEGLRDPP